MLYIPFEKKFHSVDKHLEPLVVFTEVSRRSVYSGVIFCKRLYGVSIIRSGESMENALRACCKGIKIDKILIHGEDKELCGQIQRLQQLDREASCYLTNSNKGDSREMISVCNSLPNSMDSSTLKVTRKCSRKSLLDVQDIVTKFPREEELLSKPP